MSTTHAGRLTRTFTQEIEAPPDTVFPLLCPVREGEWLDGWSDHVEIIHSASGFAEEGCVFRTRPVGRPETIWMITRHEPAERVVEFVRVTTGLVATRLRILVSGSENGHSSTVAISYTSTPLSAAGAEFLDTSFSAQRFAADMRWWQDSMNHWLRTGEMLRAAEGA